MRTKKIMNSGWQNRLRRVPPDSVLYMPGLDYANWYTDTILDYSGNANNGAINGATTTKLPSGLYVLDFDNIDNITTITDSVSIQNIFDPGATILVWVNPRSDGEDDYGTILRKLIAFSSGWYLTVGPDIGSMVRITFTQCFGIGQATRGEWQSTNRVLPIGVPSLIGITYNNSDVANDAVIYLGTGGVVTTPTINEASTPVGTRLTDVGTNLLIGNNAATTATWDGWIGLVRLLTPKIITLAEFTQYYNSTRDLFGV